MLVMKVEKLKMRRVDMSVPILIAEPVMPEHRYVNTGGISWQIPGEY